MVIQRKFCFENDRILPTVKTLSSNDWEFIDLKTNKERATYVDTMLIEGYNFEEGGRRITETLEGILKELGANTDELHRHGIVRRWHSINVGTMHGERWIFFYRRS